MSTQVAAEMNPGGKNYTDIKGWCDDSTGKDFGCQA